MRWTLIEKCFTGALTYLVTCSEVDGEALARFARVGAMRVYGAVPHRRARCDGEGGVLLRVAEGEGSWTARVWSEEQLAEVVAQLTT